MSVYRVSNVEAFRQWENDDEAELEPLLARLRGEEEPSELMLAGTAFHKVLETIGDGEFEELSANGFTFLITGIMDLVVAPIRELRASKVFIVDDEPITISGQVDAICGRHIEDHKTTGRFDPERYIAGFQWRLYLSIFGATHFRWNVFEIAEMVNDPRVYRVMQCHRLEQFRYPGMEADCEALVARFARFVRQHLEQPA